MKKRIAIVAPDLEDIGGVQSIVEMVVRLIEASDSYEYKIISLATSSADRMSMRVRSPLSWLQGVRSEKREWRGRHITHVGCMFSEFEFMHYRPRRVLFKQLKDCDLVQVIGGFAAWGAVIPPLSLPVANWAATRCRWERATLLHAGRSPKALWRSVMTRIVDRIDMQAMLAADKFMAMNPRMHDFVTKLAPERARDIFNAPPGVDVDWFVPTEKQSPAQVIPYVLSVGRFGDARKNLGLLLDAFIRVRKVITEPVQLVLAGATMPDASFWQRVEKAGMLNDVIFHSSPGRGVLRALYQGATCFALSSNEEGFGVVLVEAMACGRPVVATRCGGPEGIISEGHDGFLVPIGDADALAAKVELLIRDQIMNKIMGLNARETAVNRFSEASSGKVFFRVWDELSGHEHEE